MTDGVAPQLQTRHINKRSSLGRSRWRERCDPSWRPGSPMHRRGIRTHLSQHGNTAADPEHQTTPVCLLEETSVTCPQTCETLDWGGNSGPNNQWIVRFSWFTASLYQIEYRYQIEHNPFLKKQRMLVRYILKQHGSWFQLVLNWSWAGVISTWPS